MTRAAVVVTVAAAVLAPAVLAAPAVGAPQAVGAPMAVSIVVPITARAGDDGLLSAEALSIATSPAGNLTRELDEVLATSATVALDPMIPASIRALGSTAPETALDWLDRLESAANEVFLLAYSDADLSALIRADSIDLAQPLGFGFALDPDAFGPAQTASPTPTATPTPEPTTTPDPEDPPPLPTTDELLAWPDAIGQIAWPSDGSVAASGLEVYADTGYDAVLVTSANVSETASALVELGPTRALVADSAASDLFREASTSIDDATREQAIARLGATLDGLAAAHPGRSLVLTLDRASSFSAYGLSETVASIVARDSTQVTGLSGVLAGATESASVVEGAPADHIAAAPSLVAAVRAEDAFATILADPLALTAERRLQLLALLAVQDVDADDWATRSAAFLERSTEILGSVSIIDTGNLLVTSTQTSIPIKIANALDFAVTVRVAASPQRPLLRIDSPTDVTVEPGSSKVVRLDAEAITNGTVVVEVSLSSPSTGVAIGTPRRFDADLQAQWETVGIIVGAVATVVFAAGIARNVIVRRRRAAREHELEAQEAA
ncbi:hypothetical protein GCM10011600_23050 [Pseudolysinimonas yzui]|uniref:VWA domain-containing protein n=1 Tax=Pseudolysinimonas yzui TaxID=2708254 RepID=A0A8J3GRJ1_9MICO|nr:hypothetical protein GCM10011600_23050 [Pseudolysinimonas yzui]